MSERKPREFEIEVCPGCGCDPEACVCDECDEIETVPVVEDLGPERMLTWAIDRLGEDAVDPLRDRDRMVPIIERALSTSTVVVPFDGWENYREAAEAVFAATKEASRGS